RDEYLARLCPFRAAPRLHPLSFGPARRSSLEPTAAGHSLLHAGRDRHWLFRPAGTGLLGLVLLPAEPSRCSRGRIARTGGTRLPSYAGAECGRIHGDRPGAALAPPPSRGG